MSSDDIAKYLVGAVAALIGAFATAAFAVARERLFPRQYLVTALRADARGARAFATRHIAQFEAAAAAAETIERLITSARWREITFEKLTALPGGWAVTAPAADLLGHGQRLEVDEADAVMKYLHSWNMVICLEARYRTSVDTFLDALPRLAATAKVGTDEVLAAAVVREHIVRVKDGATALASRTRLLLAQADRICEGSLMPFTPDEEAAAKQRGSENRSPRG